MRNRGIVAGLGLVALIGLAGCASSPEEGSGGDPTTPATSTASTGSEAPQGTQLEISWKDGRISPLGKTIEVTRGETITLVITADAPGELHVHSSPEMSIEFGAGTTSQSLTFDQYGKIEMESHDTSQVVAQFEVR